MDGGYYLLKCYSFREVLICKEDTKDGKHPFVALGIAISCYSHIFIWGVILNQQDIMPQCYFKIYFSFPSEGLYLFKINLELLNVASSDLAVYTNLVTYLTSYGILSI